MAEVFCGKCRFFKFEDECYWDNRCKHSDNMHIVKTYVCAYKDVIEKPCKLNENNDCDRYQKKWWVKGE